MNAFHCLLNLVRADLQERVRSKYFIVVVGATICLAFLFVPPNDAGYIAGVLPYSSTDSGHVRYYRGLYNSAWIGTMVALTTSMLLSLPGFYLVKNTIGRDERTGVGQIIATTPLSKHVYTIGKWFANLAALTLWILILVLASLAMQLVRGEVLEIRILDMIAPFVFFALPVAALVAALAVFFEVMPLLRSSPGNVIYFFLWLGGLVLVMENDLFGWELVFSSVQLAVEEAFSVVVHASIGINPVQGSMQTFTWQGVSWTTEFLFIQAIWIGIALAIALFSVLFFHRFDPASERFARNFLVAGVFSRSPLRRKPHRSTPALSYSSESQEVVLHLERDGVKMASMPPLALQFRMWRTFIAELRLAMKGQRWWWYLIAAGMWAGTLLLSMEDARRIFYPLVWIWPLFLWSELGTREVKFNTAPMVFSCPQPLYRQLLPAWLTGFCITVLIGSGMGFRYILTRDTASLFAWAVGAVFIPSLATCMGCWSRSSKLFVVVYVILWYFGPVGKLVIFDFMAAWPETVSTGLPRTYLIIALILFGLAFVGRWRQLVT